jgi:hypothetical protein
LLAAAKWRGFKLPFAKTRALAAIADVRKLRRSVLFLTITISLYFTA